MSREAVPKHMDAFSLGDPGSFFCFVVDPLSSADVDVVVGIIAAGEEIPQTGRFKNTPW